MNLLRTLIFLWLSSLCGTFFDSDVDDNPAPCSWQALESLNKKDMTEIKSYGRPPMLVEKVMEAVMILRGSEPTWPEAKKQLGESLAPEAAGGDQSLSEV